MDKLRPASATRLVSSARAVLVMPWFNPEYYGWFWHGLRTALPDRKLRFSTAPFPALRDTDFFRPKDTFAFVVDGQRFSISANDFCQVNQVLAEWSDVHGRVNVTEQDVRERGFVPLGPAFGFRAFTKRDQALLAARFLRFRPAERFGPRQLRATLARQAGRAGLEEYRPTQPTGRPFYAGTYWAQHSADNADRVEYLEVLHEALGPDGFCGGLVPLGQMPPELEHLRTAPLSHAAYLERVRASPFVFNHPAVHGCLGWKLGEFLALGKAIISRPVSNALPAPLVHGVHVHVVDGGRESLAEAVALLARDAEYRNHLGRGAREYFDEHVHPTQSVTRLLDR